jgi:hypothetical protein
LRPELESPLTKSKSFLQENEKGGETEISSSPPYTSRIANSRQGTGQLFANYICRVLRNLAILEGELTLDRFSGKTEWTS